MKSLVSKSIIFSSALLISYGCNTAEFAGKQRAKQPGSVEAVSCKVSPQVVLPGEQVTVTISGASNYGGRFQQKITGPKTSTQNILIKTDAGYTLQSGLANTFVFNEQGDYTVTLSEIDYNAGIDSSCKFKVFKECPVGTERVGSNVAFIIDNSGSHGKSDCPGAKEVVADNGQVSYQCNAETNREIAVNYATAMLGKAGEAGGKAISHVATAIFPERSKVSSGYVLGKSGWVDSSDGLSAVSSDLKVLRTPAGMTPYGDGIEAAKSLFQSSPDTSKRNVVIFVTDGYPTDQDPYWSMLKAQNLKKDYRAEIITVMVSQGDKASLIAKHKDFIKGIEESSNSPWYVTEYGSYDEYFGDLLGNSSKKGLLEEMSDQIVNVSKASELKKAFESLIQEKALSCE